MHEELSPRKLSPAACAESEGIYRSLFENSRDALMTGEPPSGRFTSGNRAALKMFGAKNEEEFLSHGPRDLSPERQPDGRNSAEKAEEMIETALREGSHFFEWTHRRIDGEEFPADVLLTRMELEGKVIILATVRDVTERKRAEQTLRESETRYRALFEASPLPKWLYDPTSLAILAVNDAAVEHYGYSRDEFQSMTIKDLRPPEEVPKLLTALERTRPGNHMPGCGNIVRRTERSLMPTFTFTR